MWQASAAVGSPVVENVEMAVDRRYWVRFGIGICNCGTCDMDGVYVELLWVKVTSVGV